MEKKKLTNLSVFIFALTSVFISVMFRPLTSLDELWQYGFARNMAVGLVPYQDTNMVVVPFSMWISGLFLKCFGEEMYVYRLVGVLICTASTFLLYKLLLFMKVNVKLAICMVAYICAYYSSYFTYDYNYLIMAIQMLLIYMYLKKLQGNGSFWDGKLMLLGIGVCSGLPIITKQSTGLTIMLASVFLYLYIWKDDSLKKKMLFCIAVILPGTIFLIWLLVMGILEEFISYAISGIGKFSNQITVVDYLFRCGPINTCVGVLVVIILVCSFYKVLATKNVGLKQSWFIMLVLSLGGIMAAYPITDNIHVCVAMFPVLFMGILLLNEKMKDTDNISNMVVIFSVVIGVFMPIWVNMEENIKCSELNHLKYVWIDERLEERIKNVNTYMAELNTEDIYIIDATSFMYKIPMDLYAKEYDLCLYGAWGNQSIQEVMGKLKEREGYIFIQKEGNTLNWQVPKEAVAYVRENFEKIDEVEEFDVYRCGKGGIK